MRGCVMFMVVFTLPFFEGIIYSLCSSEKERRIEQHSEFQVNAAKIRGQNQAVALFDIYTIKDNIKTNKNKRSVKKSHGNTSNKQNHVNDGQSYKGLPGYYNSSIKKFPPEFKDPSKMYPMDMKPSGSSIRLKCVSAGNPIPNITWFKNNDLIVRSYLPPTYGKWSMALDELTKADIGEYKCLVCNELGCISHSVNLQVQDRYPSKPYIKDGYPGNITVKVNKKVQLSCPLITDLEPYVYWIKAYDNFTSSINEGGMDEIPNGYNIESDEPTDKPETLTISNVTYEDRGWYICIAQNTLGVGLSKGYLTVVDQYLEEYKVEQHEDGFSNMTVLSLISFIMVLLISITIVTIVITRLRKEKNKKLQAAETIRVMMEELWTKIVKVDYNINGNDADALVTPSISIEKIRYCELPQNINETSFSLEYILPVDTKWEVARERLFLGKVLGEGEFGKVYKAECIRTPNTSLPGTVAVKTLKEGHSDTDMLALVSEMEIMKLVGKHENIINLLGCCTQDGPLYVVMEYAQNGCLRNYLKRHKPHKNNASTENLLNKPPTQKELIYFVWQVAKGMTYLASRGCIHRDLAARNVLVSADMVLKIADFGLARDVRDSDYYRKRTAGKLPARWMAPESLRHNYYTTKSDVWSFGVLAWEIMMFGCTPYPNVSVHFLYQYLKSGKRMGRPDDCSEDMYAIMMHCWNFDPDDRPRFADLDEKVQRILEQF